MLPVAGLDRGRATQCMWNSCDLYSCAFRNVLHCCHFTHLGLVNDVTASDMQSRKGIQDFKEVFTIFLLRYTPVSPRTLSIGRATSSDQTFP